MLWANHDEVAHMYHDCATSHTELIEAISSQKGVIVNGKAVDK